MLALATGMLWSLIWLQPVRAAAAPRLPSPAQIPLDGPPHVVDGFDPPDQPWRAGHRGVDLAGSTGQAVRAAAAGTVSYANTLAGRGVVVIKHGSVRTTYEPVTASVSVGDRVTAGTTIGHLDRGHCSAPQACLHWGLKRGDRYLDPMRLAAQSGPAPAAGGHYRLLPASARKAARERARHRKRIQQQAVPSSGGKSAAAGPAGSHGFSLPVSGPVTSPYGKRFHPIFHRWKLHDGTDFGAACGTPIRAPYDGTVKQRYLGGGYGNRLILDHGVVDGKRVVTGLNHARSYSVAVGTKVHRGDVVGRVGQTGYATGCHLHLMTWLNGKLTNSLSWY